MRNFESENDYTEVDSGIYQTPDYKLSKLPMVITSAEGEIIDANKAFSVFAALDNDFQKKSCNLFELSGIKPFTELPGPGIWKEKTTKFNHTLKNFLYSSTLIENTAKLNLRLYTFIDTGAIPAKSETDIAHANEESREIMPERTNWYTQLHKQAGLAYWNITFEKEFKVETFNFFEVLGISEPEQPITTEDILHKTSIHPDDLPDYVELLRRVEAQKRSSYECNYRIVCGNDVVKYIQNHSRLDYDNNGNLCNWEGMLQDISPFKKLSSQKQPAFKTSQLIHSQFSLDLLLKVIYHAVSSHIPAHDLCVVLKNKTSDLNFHFLNEHKVTSEKRPFKNGLIEYVLKTGEPLMVSASEIQYMILEHDITNPERAPQSWVGIPLKMREKTIGVLCLQSSTKEVIFNEDDKAVLLFIAEQIGLAIQKLQSEEWLIKAKNSAENSSRLKSSLLANMSHELRTPMTGILGFSEILNEELEDPRLKSMAGTIFKSAGRLMSTLNSIIDLSALEADKDSINLKSINTRLMMQPLLKVAYSIASDKGLYLRTSIPPDLFIKADEKLLSQLLHHLIDNALKFTIDGGISISAYTLNKTSSTATIRINDTGIGIAPEHHKMIFDDFRQVSEGFSRTFEGSGLGLSLCSKISRLLNAKMWVDSIEGKGSDFYVELPVALPETIEKTGTGNIRAIRTHRLSKGSVPDVLIVEDNEINRRLAALYLREICNTEMAENGYVAIEKIKRKKYDAILMDINLGAGPDGLSIAKQIGDFEMNKDTPIIAVTGYTMHGDKEKLLANGCTHYIAKPYDKQTLLKLFSEILYQESALT